MNLTECTIRFQSVILEFDVPIMFEMKFQLPPDDPTEAYAEAKKAAIACLISEGAQYDPSLIETSPYREQFTHESFTHDTHHH